MLIQVNIICVCVYTINEFELFDVFVIGLPILSFCLNIKSTMEIQSGLCETIESTSSIPKNNTFAIVYTICDSCLSATHTSDSDIIHNNTGDLHFVIPGNTSNNGNILNQSATCGNGNGVTNKVKSGDDDIYNGQTIDAIQQVYGEYIYIKCLMLY